MEAVVKTRSIGGSLVVTLPSEIVKLEDLKEGEYVEIKVKKRKRDYFGALKGMGSFKEEDKARGQLD
ncbi:MAG: AbrB/MazE/SpoVT family DNA-binding domain-containing protein [Nanoarchaeota archaeon]|nr:AbrB/MazE/SpoVT family DNA-binding domain-containing protein [Nanoarchaeota archaeon]